jgi:hypothetical protein
MSNETQTSKPPIKKFRVGDITANIWERTTDKGTFHNVTLERSYKDGDDWKSTGSFSFQDIGSIKLALAMAEKHIATLIQANHAE